MEWTKVLSKSAKRASKNSEKSQKKVRFAEPIVQPSSAASAKISFGSFSVDVFAPAQHNRFGCLNSLMSHEMEDSPVAGVELPATGDPDPKSLNNGKTESREIFSAGFTESSSLSNLNLSVSLGRFPAPIVWFWATHPRLATPK